MSRLVLMNYLSSCTSCVTSVRLPLEGGDYNVVMPESTPGGKYKIRVGLFGDDSVYACSETFEVLNF